MSSNTVIQSRNDSSMALIVCAALLLQTLMARFMKEEIPSLSRIERRMLDDALLFIVYMLSEVPNDN